MTKNKLGIFQLESGWMVIADPGIGEEFWITKALGGMCSGVVKGGWEASIELETVGRWGTRVCSLTAVHSDADDPNWERMGEVGVDTGQAGIFDGAFFRNDEAVKDLPKAIDDSFYGACCYHTLESYGGVFPFGAVSLSGLGDGVYLYYATLADREINGFRIVFIEEDEVVDLSGEG